MTLNNGVVTQNNGVMDPLLKRQKETPGRLASDHSTPLEVRLAARPEESYAGSGPWENALELLEERLGLETRSQPVETRLKRNLVVPSHPLSLLAFSLLVFSES